MTDKQDMGLGKTVQTLARIVEGVATPAEIKAGYKGGTLYVTQLVETSRG
jgi:SNF2 family DNA or RNA helicase